jgi:hypothetical protein
MGTKAADLLGMRFGKLIVTGRAQTLCKRARWDCLCDCGAATTTLAKYLLCGDTTSCGCRKREALVESRIVHSNAGSLTYWVWGSMVQRCSNPKNKAYKDYGGRGIKVCDRWREFAKFFEDMGEKPDDMTLDRKDNDGDYTLHNCRWSSATEQNNNRRNSIYIDGVPLKKWAADNSLPYSTAYYRYKLTFTLEQP